MCDQSRSNLPLSRNLSLCSKPYIRPNKSMSDEPSEPQRAYEARLQRRLLILKGEFDAGKVRIAEGLQVIESLKRVCYAPDGTIDLSTVDGLVRSMALAIEAMHDREEMKESTSLAKIQTAYFAFLETNFGPIFKQMTEHGLDPHQVGLIFSREPSRVTELCASLPEILATIEDFWSSVGPIAIAHVEDMHDSLKGVFGGDLFPSPRQNIASMCSLYTDTLVLPDPFLRSRHLFESLGDSKRAYYLIKHALNLLQYRDLACADVIPPIVVILPDVTALEEEEKQYFYKLGQDDAVIHGSRLFGRHFGSFEEMLDFCEHLDTVERAAAEIRAPERALFDTEWEGTLQVQLERALKHEVYSEVIGTNNPGLILAQQALGRMSTSSELLVKARRLRGTPVLDAATSWQYLVWKLEYDAARVEKIEGIKDLHTVRGLQALSSNKMRWLGRVPPSALIEMRQTGALCEIRKILANGIEELANTNTMNFNRTSDHVFGNIQAAFVEHQKSIDALVSKKWKFAGADIGSWIVVGSLAATAAATGAPIWGIVALAADQLLKAPKLRDIPKSIKELADESRKLKKSPVGLLFQLGKMETD